MKFKISTTDIKTRIFQPSTGKGLAILFSLLGLEVGPEVLDAVWLAVITIVGAWETARNEAPQK